MERGKRRERSCYVLEASGPPHGRTSATPLAARRSHAHGGGSKDVDARPAAVEIAVRVFVAASPDRGGEQPSARLRPRAGDCRDTRKSLRAPWHCRECRAGRSPAPAASGTEIDGGGATCSAGQDGGATCRTEASPAGHGQPRVRLGFPDGPPHRQMFGQVPASTAALMAAAGENESILCSGLAAASQPSGRRARRENGLDSRAGGGRAGLAAIPSGWGGRPLVELSTTLLHGPVVPAGVSCVGLHRRRRARAVWAGLGGGSHRVQGVCSQPRLRFIVAAFAPAPYDLFDLDGSERGACRAAAADMIYRTWRGGGPTVVRRGCRYEAWGRGVGTGAARSMAMLHTGHVNGAPSGQSAYMSAVAGAGSVSMIHVCGNMWERQCTIRRSDVISRRRRRPEASAHARLHARPQNLPRRLRHHEI
jgi:hypothetical protein